MRNRMSKIRIDISRMTDHLEGIEKASAERYFWEGVLAYQDTL